MRRLSGRDFLLRSPSRTLPRNLKRGGCNSRNVGAFRPPAEVSGVILTFRPWFSPKMPLTPTSPEGAGWDEESSNIGS